MWSTALSHAADVQLGRLLVAEGLVSEEQLAEALAQQSTGGTYVPLGRLLVDKKAVTARQLALVLERSDKRLKIGEVLRRNGSITEEQLQAQLYAEPLSEITVPKSGFASTLTHGAGVTTPVPPEQASGARGACRQAARQPGPPASPERP